MELNGSCYGGSVKFTVPSPHPPVRIKVSDQDLSEAFQQSIPINAFVLRNSTEDTA